MRKKKGAPATSGPKPQASRQDRLALVAALGLAVLSFALYAPALGHEFLNYDDDLYIVRNPGVRLGLSPPGVAWAFTTFYGANWFPLTWLSWQADYTLFGMTARAFHLGNLLLHSLSAGLLLLALHRLTSALGPSAFVAAVFAFHPLHVESVAWAAARKDPLSGLFFVLSLGAYAAYARKPERGRLAIVALCLGLGLLSKPVLVTLPFVLLLLDLWPLGRLSPAAEAPSFGRLLREKVPLFLLAAAGSASAFIAQRSAEAVQSFEAFPPSVRVLNALQSYVFYLRAALWPTELAVYYPHPGAAIALGPSVLSAALLSALTLLALRARRARPWLAVGWLWFLGMLVPMIGLVQVGQQARADRYMYLPLIGLALAAAFGARDAFAGTRFARGLPALAIASLVALGALTQRQLATWKDSVTLFEHALRVTRDNPVAHLNLGVALLDRGRIAEAAEHLREAIRIHPGAAEAHAGLGEALARQGESGEAEQHFESALRLEPRLARARNGFGRLLAEEGKLDQALTQFREAIAVDPSYPEPYNNLASALLRQGGYTEAVEYLQKAVALDAGYAEAYGNWGIALMNRGDADAAIARFRQALALKPDLTSAHLNLALALSARREFEAALGHYREAMRTSPDDVTAIMGAALTLANMGAFDEALPHFERAAALRPDDPQIQTSWGMALASRGDLPRALERYQSALRLDPRHAEAHNALGMALGNAGRVGEAIEHFRAAAAAQPDYAPAHNNLALALASAGRLEEAVARLRDAVRIAPDYADAHNNLGVFLARLGRLDEAAGEFRETLRLAPERADARSNLDKLQARRGRP